MRHVCLVAALAALLLPAPARAFCGFYVGSADGALVNEATMVVLLRDGTDTVLSMRNDYHGPPEDFAMVVPVPEVLSEENVKVLEAAIFDKVERLAAPRLVEYWEQDPCAQRGGSGYGAGAGGLGLIGTGRGGGGSGAGSTVTVEAEFAVGEYDIVILSASDSAGLEGWLRANDYRIPEGAEALLRPYVENESKFFVAKVDVDRVAFEEGRAVLSPLRVHYQSESFSLPVRLGLLSAGEDDQDLIVHILANGQRYEVANYENVTIPTNVEVAPAARERFGELYAALFDETLASHPGAVVTEYAWTASSCDPCPGPTLDARDIATLGGDVAHDGPIRVTRGGTIGLGNLGIIGGSTPIGLGNGPVSGPLAQVRSGPVEVEGTGFSAEVARRVIRRHINEIRYCYAPAATRTPGLRGRLVLELVVGDDGRVRSTAVGESTMGDPQLESCVAAAGRRWRFPTLDSGQSLTITHPFELSPAPGSSRFSAGGGLPFGAGAGPFAGWVLTRLHYRYSADDLGEDLVFREAAPIAGGRETGGGFGLGGGVAEDEASRHDARPAPTNNFQGRYIIRHEWEGAIECDNPNRGVWGGPPAGHEAGGGTLAATDLSQAPRGDASVLDALIVGRGGAAAATDRAEAEAPEPEPEAAPAAAAARGDEGCGCRVATAGPRAPWPWLAFAGLLVAWRRRARNLCPRGGSEHACEDSAPLC